MFAARSSASPRLLHRLLQVSAISILLIGTIFYFPRNIAAGIGSNGATSARVAQATSKALSIEAAGNSTLGFSSIYFVNLRDRFDRLDAISLQAYLSGVEVVEHAAVEPEQIKDAGMPPTHRPVLRIPEKGCWRAHANVSYDVMADVATVLTPAIDLVHDAQEESTRRSYC